MGSQRFTVSPNEVGFLYKSEVFSRKLAPGRYTFWSLDNVYRLVKISNYQNQLYVTNQEVLTKDRIALRFSFFGLWAITDAEKALSHYDIANPDASLQRLRYQVQVTAQLLLRDRISGYEAETLLDQRPLLGEGLVEDLNAEIATLGGTAIVLQVIDLTFPKTIQDIFAKRLEAKVRAQVELENARSQVAAARALKNAAELLKGDPEIRYLQYLETLQTIAAKGRHTFVLSQDPPKLGATPA
ncbi:MAG: SPFH domain-containing protein [Bacteroidia bacterium]|nr:SPFH domain-containing protein [Bacteroidia bacterium]